MRGMSEIVFRSSFVEGDSEYRHGSIVLISAYVLFSILTTFKGPIPEAISFCLLCISQEYSKSRRTLVAGIVLSAIPASWFFLISLIITFSPLIAGLIAFRAFVFAFAVLTGFSQINPMEIASALRRRKDLSLYVCLTWKSTPHIMKDMETSLLVNELKGEPTWKSIAISLLCVKEYSDFYSEGLYTKLESFSPKFKYNRRVLAFQAFLASLLAAIYFLCPAI